MEDAIFDKAASIKKEIKYLKGNTGELQHILTDAHLFGVPLDMIKRWIEEFTAWNEREIIKLKEEFNEL